MADTPLIVMEERPDEEVLEDLCLELRYIALANIGLAYNAKMHEHISQVKALHAELAKRGIGEGQRIDLLSRETGWKMQELLEDCLAFPRKVPYVRDPDGIRRALRCRSCRKAEFPPFAKLFWFCDKCMELVVGAVRSRVPCMGIILFRTYSSECRCAHADGDTVLATDGNSDFELRGVCEMCIVEEIEKRKANPRW
jgi:hypothetical protein